MKKTTVYLPDDVHAQLERQRLESRRSFNAELLFLLDRVLVPAPRVVALPRAVGDPPGPRAGGRGARCQHGLLPSQHCKSCDP